ncbi:MAG TPA: SGNH/GDSL hydrolase family protein [Chitinophagaceae bacterium]|nr:SGNH/GDSL hydrolase family protein [Chitinophagaceae bacterium]
MNQPTYTYLALGDSYTIGEGLPETENFPHQAVALLQARGYAFSGPEVLARTGWTTSELAAAMASHRFNPPYDWVTLLIGVNNQYRGESLDDYRREFAELLDSAVRLAGSRTDHVLVLSIPDWGVTPFARDRHPEIIAVEIDGFNRVNRELAARRGVTYLDITQASRLAGARPGMLAPDNLHPSGRQYGQWAAGVADAMARVLPHKTVAGPGG